MVWEMNKHGKSDYQAKNDFQEVNIETLEYLPRLKQEKTEAADKWKKVPQYLHGT